MKIGLRNVRIQQHNRLVQLQPSTQTTAAVTASGDKSAVAVSENNGTNSNVTGNAVVPDAETTESKGQPSADIEMAELTANIDEDADRVMNGTSESLDETVASNSINESVDDENATAANLDETVSTNNSEADESGAAEDE